MTDGGPAFPVSTRSCVSDSGYGHQDSESTWQFGGMSLRDYFAGQALQGIVANKHPLENEPDEGYASMLDACAGEGKCAAEMSYFYADAMLKAREAKS